MGKNTAGYGIGKELPQRFKLVFADYLAQIGHLAPSEQLYPLKREGVVKARQGQPGPVEVRNGNVAHESPSAANAPEVQGIVFLEVQAQESYNFV